jgi:predicted AAA+ superfamily ATPase
MLDEIRESIYQLQVKIASLLLYQNVLEQEPWENYERLLQCIANYDLDENKNSSRRVSYLLAYGRWFRAIAGTGYTWRDYVISQILTSDNPFSYQSQTKDIEQLPAALVSAAKYDLKILGEVSLWGGDKLVDVIDPFGDRPVAWQLHTNDLSQLLPAKRSLLLKFQATDDWTELLSELANYYKHSGTGIFTDYEAFRWHKGHLEGIAYPDLVKLSDLVGYESQRQSLYKNTEAFLAGYHALHVLLYGSRGTGKSSMVKSLMSAFSDRGLRLVEVAKDDLKDLPIIAEVLRKVPQKFIVFVDDLSFEEESEDYKAIKVLLEGNLSSQPNNLLVYATSNRRHLLREYFSDRPSLKTLSTREEVNPWDTMQEKLSLSDRFGLTLTFLNADQEIYLKIVHHLANRADIKLPTEDLNFRALQWATRNNGQSGRTAQQFIDFLQADLNVFNV